MVLNQTQTKSIPDRLRETAMQWWARDNETIDWKHDRYDWGLPSRLAVLGLSSGLDYFLKSFTISFAAFAPDPPVNPAPGCVPLPHRYRFRMGVR